MEASECSEEVILRAGVRVCLVSRKTASVAVCHKIKVNTNGLAKKQLIRANPDWLI